MVIKRVAVIGAGTIGRGWIPLFAKAGIEVAVYDSDDEMTEQAIRAAEFTLSELASLGLVDDANEALKLVRPVATLAAAVQGADFVQESVPESVAQKRSILGQIDAIADSGAIVSSSCSSLYPDDIFVGTLDPERCLVSHPFNPPHLIRLVELVPGSMTTEDVLIRTKTLMKRLGQVPVVIRKAVPGYVANRLQTAVVNEAMSLVARGVVSPHDLDLCMTESLGRRWSFIGPFETMDLNADDGFAGYAARFQKHYEEMGGDLRVAEPWSDEARQAVISARREHTPLAVLRSRQEWRDRILMEMLLHPPGGREADGEDQSLQLSQKLKGVIP